MQYSAGDRLLSPIRFCPSLNWPTSPEAPPEAVRWKQQTWLRPARAWAWAIEIAKVINPFMFVKSGENSRVTWIIKIWYNLNNETWIIIKASSGILVDIYAQRGWWHISLSQGQSAGQSRDLADVMTWSSNGSISPKLAKAAMRDHLYYNSKFGSEGWVATLFTMAQSAECG